MPTFTQKFEDFLDNNHPGGYISTSTNISDSDLDARITQNVNNRGFLTSNSHLPWNQIDNKPTLFSGNYNDLTDKPTLFSGSYNDLTNKPTLFSGSYNDLADKPALFSGDYNDLSNKPTLFSGDYNDLSNKPTINIINTLSTGQCIATINNIDINAPIPTPQDLGLSTIATSANYDDLNNTFETIDFSDFIYRYHNNTWITLSDNNPDTQQDYNIIKNCGNITGYIKDIDELYNNTDSLTNISLINKLANIQMKFDLGKICYLKLSDNKYHLITDLSPIYDNQQLIGYELFCLQLNQSNYFLDLINSNTITDEQIRDTLMHITLLSAQITIIIDLNKNILFSLFKQTYPVLSNNESIYVDPGYNGVNVQISAKANNKLQLIANLGEEGLYVGS